MYIHSVIPQGIHYVGDLRGGKAQILELNVVFEDIPGRVVKDLFAVPHHDDPLHVAGDIVHAVGNEDDGHGKLLLHLRDQSQDLIAATGIKSGSGLVQDENTGIHGENARDRGASLLSA